MKFRHVFEFILVVVFTGLLALFPQTSRRRFGSFIGTIFCILGIRRHVATDNLRKAEIFTGSGDIKKCVHRSYRHFGRAFSELLFLNSNRLTEGLDYRLLAHPDFFRSLRNGAVLVSAHIGNWEVMGRILAEKKVRLAAVVRRQENPRVDRMINAIREKAGMTVVYDTEIFRMARLLKEGYAVALLADQDLGQPSVKVSFFGRPCRTVSGPARFALRFGCPMWICYSMQKSAGPLDCIIEPLPVDVKDTVSEITQRYTARFEEIIRANPDQWFWAHRRWKINWHSPIKKS